MTHGQNKTLLKNGKVPKIKPKAEGKEHRERRRTMAGGRPYKFKTVEEIKTAIDRYFAECDKTQEPYTITGLAMALDTSRKVLLDYETKYDEVFGEELSDAVKKAKQKIEKAYELRNIKQGRGGDIFALKNFGWRDKQEIEHSGGLEIKKLEDFD